MSKTGYSMDLSKFAKDFTRITQKTIPDKAGDASFKVALMIIGDAIKVIPKVPADKKDLRASQFIELLPTQKLGVRLGFNIEYAAKWHELDKAKADKISWTTPGSGRKYLSSKLSMFKNKYMEFLASLIHA